jgi:hypothetical protein
MIKILLIATPAKVKIWQLTNRKENTLKVIILDDKLNVELSVKSKDKLRPSHFQTENTRWGENLN